MISFIFLLRGVICSFANFGQDLTGIGKNKDIDQQVSELDCSRHFVCVHVCHLYIT